MPGSAVRPEAVILRRPPTAAPVPALLRPPGSTSASREPAAALAEAIAALIEDCLIAEVDLTPKPGLVDRANTGAHRDMDVSMFVKSAAAIRPSFARLVGIGIETADIAADAVLPLLRPDGLAAERAMLAATGGVNTHKGAIFAFGLVAAGLGRVHARDGVIDRDLVCEDVAAMTRGLVARELAHPHEPRTAGERLYQRHGLTGARGAAESGFSLVRDGSLPVYEAALAGGFDAEVALSAAFLHLLEHNADTNLAARGGIDGLRYARAEAARLNAAGGVRAPHWRDDLSRLDDVFIQKNLSPGGSADLLALTLFLHRLQTVGRG